MIERSTPDAFLYFKYKVLRLFGKTPNLKRTPDLVVFKKNDSYSRIFIEGYDKDATNFIALTRDVESYLSNRSDILRVHEITPRYIYMDYMDEPIGYGGLEVGTYIDVFNNTVRDFSDIIIDCNDAEHYQYLMGVVTKTLTLRTPYNTKKLALMILDETNVSTSVVRYNARKSTVRDYVANNGEIIYSYSVDGKTINKATYEVLRKIK